MRTPSPVSSPNASAWRFSAEQHARLRVGVEQDLDHLVGRVEPARELLHEAERDLGVVRDHLLERRRVDDQALRVLEHHRRRRARLVVEDGHLADELAAAQRRQRALLVAHLLEDLHDARLDDVHLLAALPLPEEHLAGRGIRGRSAEKSGSDIGGDDTAKS